MSSVFTRVMAMTRGWRMRVPQGLLVLAGTALVAAAAWTMWRHLSAPMPYRYLEPPNPASPGQVRTLQVVAADERLVAEADVASGPAGAVLLDWRAQVDEPVVYLPVPGEETQALAGILAKHREEGTPVLAWWDTSRQLRHWGGGEMLFDQHLGLPLFVPPPWAKQKSRLLQVESHFWGEVADARQRATFETFAHALTLAEDDGVKLLRSLVPGKKAVVVLHVRDVLMLAEMFPAALGVSFQDFADSGDVHRSVRGVHGWLKEGEQSAYTVIKLPGNRIRAVALRDEASANTLIARLLPFIGNRQEDVLGMTLVYRRGAFSIFELSASAAQ